MAIVTVTALVVAGGVLAWVEVGSLGALVSTAYGRLLLTKLALVGAVLAAAAYNRTRLVPALLDGIEPPTDG